MSPAAPDQLTRLAKYVTICQFGADSVLSYAVPSHSIRCSIGEDV